MHVRTVFGLIIVALSLVIALLHWTANMYYLYWAWWWFDILMHFLGGFLIALAALWWIRFEIPIGLRPRVPRFVTALLVTLVIGILWELFEYTVGAYGAGNYVLDTVSDIGMDVVGMLLAYVLFTRYAKG